MGFIVTFSHTYIVILYFALKIFLLVHFRESIFLDDQCRGRRERYSLAGTWERKDRWKEKWQEGRKAIMENV